MAFDKGKRAAQVVTLSRTPPSYTPFSGFRHFPFREQGRVQNFTGHGFLPWTSWSERHCFVFLQLHNHSSRLATLQSSLGQPASLHFVLSSRCHFATLQCLALPPRTWLDQRTSPIRLNRSSALRSSQIMGIMRRIWASGGPREKRGGP